MTFTKGSRCSITANDVVHHGVVDRVKDGLFVVVLDDGRVTKPVSERLLSPSSEPLPAGRRTWKKGDRVEFDAADGVVHGTVASSSLAKSRVVADGGELSYTLPTAGLRPSSKPAPTFEPTPMDRWGVVGYKAHRGMSEETECFEATVTLDGKPVLRASNRGQGGCNSYHGDAAVARKFEEDAKAWEAQFGWDDPFEASDTWIGYVHAQRPYGVTDREYVEGFVASMRDMGSPRP